MRDKQTSTGDRPSNEENEAFARMKRLLRVNAALSPALARAGGADIGNLYLMRRGGRNS
jgi:hypothetical protein